MLIFLLLRLRHEMPVRMTDADGCLPDLCEDSDWQDHHPRGQFPFLPLVCLWVDVGLGPVAPLVNVFALDTLQPTRQRTDLQLLASRFAAAADSAASAFIKLELDR